MGLSDDQRAMLRLLAQRGEEGYDDVAALMGLSVEEVRAKVAEALAVVAEEGALDPEQPQAAPEPPAVPEPETRAVAAPEPEPAPKATPAAEPKPAPAAPKPARPRKASTPPRLALPSGNGPRAAIAAAAIVLVAIVVVLIVSGGGSDSSTTSAGTTSGESSAASQTTPTSDNAEVTKAVLKPVGGSSGSGVAIFGRVKNSLALQIVAKGLAPTTKGSTEYTVWLAQSPQRMLPLASTEVGSDGRIGAQFKVPTEVLAYLANGTFDQLVLTKTSNSALQASLAEATKEERAPKYTGTEVLRGTVVGPIVGAAKRLEEEK